MFYNSYRTTKAANAERLKLGQTGKSVISNPRERLMNIQKREKLKTLLITKFMQKYGIKRPEQYLENEINKFLQGEKLNNNDLQKLDAKIHRILIENKGFSNLQDTLNASLSQNTIPHQNNESIYPNNQIPNMNINLTEENINQNYSKSNADILSFNKYPKFKNPREELAWLEAEEAKYSKKVFNEVKKDNNINNKSNEYPPQIDFSTFDDEWAALAEYNRRMYLQDIKEEKIKDHELKKRTKDELDVQVKEKLKREYENELRNLEYAKIMKEHLKDLEEIEKKKAEDLKQQRLREQQNRIAQMRDEYTRKRIEELKNKKWERNLVKHYQDEIEDEKKAEKERKEKEYKAYLDTKRDNEISEQMKAEQLKKEKEDDIKFIEENNKIEERKELERKLYFKRIDRNSNNFMTGVAKEALDNIIKEEKDEEDRINFYIEQKNKKEVEKEEKDRIKRQLAKNELKHYLDLQIEEKKKITELEKELDGEQARIWKIDSDKYKEDERNIEQKIRRMNRRNLETLNRQVQMRKDKNNLNKKMSPTEFAMNKNTLVKAKIVNEKPEYA
jgi:hypothetical protein